MPPVLGGAAAMAVMPSNSTQPHHLHHHHHTTTMQPSPPSSSSSSSSNTHHSLTHHPTTTHSPHQPPQTGSAAAAAATVLYQPYNLQSAPSPQQQQQQQQATQQQQNMHHHQHVAAYHHAQMLQHHAQQQQQQIAAAQRYATLAAAAAASASSGGSVTQSVGATATIERREAEVRELESREREAKIERERIEKQRAAEQAVHKHFEESFRLAQQKVYNYAQQRNMQAAAAVAQMPWNSYMPLAPPGSAAAAAAAVAAARLHHHPGGPPPPTSSREEQREREQQHQQLERSQQEAAAANEYAAQQSLAYLRAAAVPQQNPQQVSRPSSVPGKVDYPPPPAHSRTSKSTSSSSSVRHDKQSVPNSQQQVHQLPKAEPNVSLFGYAGYSPQSSAFSAKTSSSPVSAVNVKVEHHVRQEQQHLPNPPPLLSDHKSSVIVKNEGSSSRDIKQPVAAPAHSPSPKMMSYLQPVAVSGSQHKSPYECRSPTQSPHHTSRPGSAHLPPTHHRHSPHQTQQSVPTSSASSPLSQQQQPPPEPRYLSRPEPQMAYPPPHQAKSPYSAYPHHPHHQPSASPTSHYAAPASSKPKVSSPAPSHIYGKPNSGIMTGTPVCRASTEPSIASTTSTTTAAPLPLTSKANVTSSFQPVVGAHHPAASSAPYLPPPPAHSSRSPYESRAGYNSPASKLPPPPLHSAPGIGKLPPPLHLLPPSAAGLPPRQIPGIPHPGVHHQQQQVSVVAPPTSQPMQQHMPHHHPQQQQHQSSAVSCVQTQPLDLGVERSGSPKRKPLASGISNEPVALELAKKRRLDDSTVVMPQQQQPPVSTIQQNSSSIINTTTAAIASPQLSRVSEPSPLIASAATSITQVVNPSLSSLQPNSQSQVNVPSVSPAPRTASGDGSLRPSSAGGTAAPSASPAPSSAPSPVPTSAPGTPAKADSPAPARPPSSTSYPVHKLKKAWLQRHSGEDGTEDTTGLVGSGSCVTLPLNIANKQTNGSADKDKTSVNTTSSSASSTTSSSSNTTTTTTTSLPSAVNSIHNIGSMAVNSISKTKVPIKQRKTPVKEPINGHVQNQAASESNHEDSSNSEPERKAPPKRKAPKVKRKKGAAGKAGWASQQQQQAASQQQEQRSRAGKKTKQPRPAASESSNESEEAGSDSNSEQRFPTRPMASPGNGNKKVPKKRGRKPRTAKDAVKVKEEEEEEEEDYQPRQKKKRLEAKAAAGGGGGVGNNKNGNKKRRNNRISTMEEKPEEEKLIKTGQSWIQDEVCMKYTSTKISKCRECRLTPNQRDKMSSVTKSSVTVFCRFYAFRRMQFTKSGTLSLAGFNDPFIDADENDIQLWLPGKDNRLIKRDKYTEETQKDSKKDWDKGDFDITLAHQIIEQVGDQFCDLIHQEKSVYEEHLARVGSDSEEQTVIWKRVVKGVREMCDLCDTTLFNYHWTCGKCGFVVCIDCYEARKNKTVVWTENTKGRDKYAWLMCANRQTHVPEQLLLTQIIPSDCLVQIDKRLHDCRSEWGIEKFCSCKYCSDIPTNETLKKLIKKDLVSVVNGSAQQEIKQEDQIKKESSPSGKSSESRANGETDKLSWLADVALNNEGKNDSDTDSDSDDGHSALRELLTRPSQKTNGSAPNSPDNGSAGADGATGATKGIKKSQMDTLNEVISSVIEQRVKTEDSNLVIEKCRELKHFVRRYKCPQRGNGPVSHRILNLTESAKMYPEVPHSWLCHGKLLRLHDPSSPKNYRIFQDQWKRGQPVLVSDVHKQLNQDLWHPDSFSKDFGDQKSDLVNCMTGNIVPKQPMWKFWEGFEHTSKRLKDDQGNPMLLKLKDWPSRGDFADILPKRFADLMKCVPLSEYTHRYGRLNLTSRLPDTFTRPDLGPKMYNAYGSALYPDKGTTNLHLDVSDAVNVMVYIGISKDGDRDEDVDEAVKALTEANCDDISIRRVKENGETPGALWHIYAATDADKIRDMLNAVALERGARLEPHHDPIHDQSFYLDKALRDRLYKEYGVEGYAIIQCLGDAVFVPAGAPHQVRNLHNCIKVAEDFVSPENISHCFHLTQEFRALSDTHTNHEDKLQIKNIIYHAVKDSLTALDSAKDEALAKSSAATTTTTTSTTKTPTSSS